MSIPSNVIKGGLVITGQPDVACFESFLDLLKSLPQFLGIELPVSSITNVIVSSTQPTSSQTASIWFRIGNDGGFIGIYVFSGGAWRQIYPVHNSNTQQIFWFSSKDGSVEPGFTKIDGSTAASIIPAAVATFLMTQYVNDGVNDIYFACYFSGF